MSFKFSRLIIPDIIMIEAQAFMDDRGFFTEVFKQSVFSANGIGTSFTQDNYSHSIKGVLRGLHYQLNPRPQTKLVWVTSGEIFDVAVDIRKGSPTYGKWLGEVLSTKNHRMLYIPVGFAHGFFVLSNGADVVYKVSEEYAPEYDRGIIWNDREIRIKWPLENPLLSKKDASLPSLRDAENNFVY
ncbi:MAG: dTDP-4-dehydrorhamnose 3,5-epimerase [Nitrososphaerales archaeon]